jgi:hypothetical protein
VGRNCRKLTDSTGLTNGLLGLAGLVDCPKEVEGDKVRERDVCVVVVGGASSKEKDGEVINIGG